MSNITKLVPFLVCFFLAHLAFPQGFLVHTQRSRLYVGLI